MVIVDRLRTFLTFTVGIATRKTELRPARNPLTNSSSPLTKGTQNVTTKTELGRHLAFAGIHLMSAIQAGKATSFQEFHGMQLY